MNEGTTRALRIQGDLATSTAMSALLKTHQTLLEKYRRSMNLVGPGPISFHYEDATLALAPVQAHGHWADMGTGAGFPGIVFGHLFPDVSLDLVDSRQKRCWFLNQVLLNAARPKEHAPIQVFCSRIEALQRGPYDGIVARALAKPEEVMRLTHRLLKDKGSLVLPLQQSQEVVPIDGFQLISEHPYVIDGKQRKTSIFQRCF